jgi:hypothetical protein
MDDQRPQPAGLDRVDVGGEVAPGVLAADGRALFQQDHAQARPQALQPQGDQAVGQSAAHQDDVGALGRRRGYHASALA